MEATRALNYLAAARTGDLKRAPAHTGFVGQARRDCLDHIEASVGKYGDKPKDLDTEGSLRQLLKTRSLYGELPLHLANYAFEKLRVLKGDVHPKDAAGALPPVAAGF